MAKKRPTTWRSGDPEGVYRHGVRFFGFDFETASIITGDRIEQAVHWTEKNAEFFRNHRLFVLGKILYVGSERGGEVQ